MKVCQVRGKISSCWNGETEYYDWGDLFKSKSKAEEQIPKLEEIYSKEKGYYSEFWIVWKKVIE